MQSLPHPALAQVVSIVSTVVIREVERLESALPGLHWLETDNLRLTFGEASDRVNTDLSRNHVQHCKFQSAKKIHTIPNYPEVEDAGQCGIVMKIEIWIVQK